MTSNLNNSSLVNCFQEAVIDELINTEKKYLQRLNVLVNVSQNQLEDSKFQSIVWETDKAQNQTLFANYKDIHDFHKGIFKKDLLESRKHVFKIALCFLKWKDSLITVYGCYSRHKADVDRVLERLEKHPRVLRKFQKLLKESLKEAVGKRSNASIRSFLDLPLQRCREYLWLLQALLRETGEHRLADIRSLNQAISSVEDVLLVVNQQEFQSDMPQIYPKFKFRTLDDMQLNNSSNNKQSGEAKEEWPTMDSNSKSSLKTDGFLKEGIVAASQENRKQGNVFGVELTDLIQTSKSNVPDVVRVLIDHIERKFKHVKDFYVCHELAPAAKVELLRIKLEMNHKKMKEVDMSNEDNHNVLRTVLKQFFEELPESLIPSKLYESLVKIGMEEHYTRDHRTTMHDMSELLGSQLPQGRYTRTLNYLLRHLRKMCNDVVRARAMAAEWVMTLTRNPDPRFPQTRDTIDFKVLTTLVKLLIINRKNILWRGTKVNRHREEFHLGYLPSNVYIFSDKVQKYFCIPFVREDTEENLYRADGSARKGWFLVHFDGDQPVRQIELHPRRTPILILSGKNDKDLFSLTLPQTNFGSKRNAEISSWDFNTIWRKYGGDSIFLQ